MKTAEEVYKELLADKIGLPVPSIKVKPMVIKAMHTYAAQFQQEWVHVNDRLPAEGGRYWCYIEENGESGVSHFQWNCYYDPNDKEFRDQFIKMLVTHWQPLLSTPKEI